MVGQKHGSEDNLWLPLRNPGGDPQGWARCLYRTGNHPEGTNEGTPFTSVLWALGGLVDWKAGPA